MSDLDSWATLRRAPPEEREKRREVRAAQERRATATEKQLHRKPIGEARTSQLNVRCSEAFKRRIDAERERRGGLSIADLLELALARLEKDRLP